MTAKVHLGRNVRSIRLLQGIKQALFAREMGISQQYVSKLERQQHIPPDKLEAIAKALNVSVGNILAFDERPFISDSPMVCMNTTDRSIKEVQNYFMAELAKKDRKIEELEAELNMYRNGKENTTKNSRKWHVSKNN